MSGIPSSVKPVVERPGPKVPIGYPEPVHRLLLLPHSESHTRVFTGRTGKPGNP